MRQILILGQENVTQIQEILEKSFSDVIVVSDFEKFKLNENKNTTDLIIVKESYANRLEELKDFLIRNDIPVLLIVEKNNLTKYINNEMITDIIYFPINPEELQYRTNKLTNFENSTFDDKNKITVADLIIDLEKYTVSVEQKIIDLTFKEFELLTYLASNIDTPFTRDSLLDKVWGYDYIGGYRTVDVHIRRIRSKIERNFQYIQTVRNIGYRFVDPKKNN
ncbi:MAG: DNA-binding response regulator [Dehalococcoidia bacterium]